MTPGTPFVEHELLFATSFGPDMWEATGRRLLQSFYRTQPVGRILVAHEGFKYRPIGDREVLYDLDADEFLAKFLEDNRDVIPVHLGGSTVQCNCKDSHLMHSKHHITGCHWSWMNRNASRWFRKVATLRHAADMAHRYVLWVDSDCVLKREVPLHFVVSQLRGKGFFYFRAHRPAPETGVIGIDMAAGGREFVAALCERYVSRKYLEYERWDDGYIVGTLIDDKTVGGFDVCRGKQYPRNHIIPLTTWAKFLDHNKGAHGRRLDADGKEPIMR